MQPQSDMNLEDFGLGYIKYRYYIVLEYFIDWYIPENNYQQQDEAYHWIKKLSFPKKPTTRLLIVTYLVKCQGLSLAEAEKIFAQYNEKKQTHIRKIDKKRQQQAKPPWYDRYGRQDTAKVERLQKRAKNNNRILNLIIPIKSEFACGLDILENWNFYTVEEHKLRLPNYFKPYVESEISHLSNEKEILRAHIEYQDSLVNSLEETSKEQKNKIVDLIKIKQNLTENLDRVKSDLKDEELRKKILQTEIQNLNIELQKAREINKEYQEYDIKTGELLAKLKQQEELIMQMRDNLKLLAGNVIESLVEGGSDPDEFIQMTQDIKVNQKKNQDIVKVDETAGAFPTFRKFLNIVTQLMKTNL